MPCMPGQIKLPAKNSKMTQITRLKDAKNEKNKNITVGGISIRLLKPKV